jgi:hypothetical protein
MGAILGSSLSVALFAAPATASGGHGIGRSPFLPPSGQTFFGVGDGNEVGRFTHLVGRHPSVFGPYVKWREPVGWAISAARSARARLVLSLSPASRGVGSTTSAAIAGGDGDGYLLYLGRTLAASGGVTYINLMAEMNGHWNPYCAYDSHGRSRGSAFSTGAFKQAWRRIVVIVRGGRLSRINSRLHALRLRPVVAPRGQALPVSLPSPHVAFMWIPQTVGSPAIRANSPAAYWPGGAYVDWVGSDLYSRFQNFRALEKFYRTYRRPFAFGEWGLWGRDDVRFVQRFFRWLPTHARVRMVVYFQGNRPGSTFDLRRYPRSRRLLHHLLNRRRFPDYAPEYTARR